MNLIWYDCGFQAGNNQKRFKVDHITIRNERSEYRIGG